MSRNKKKRRCTKVHLLASLDTYRKEELFVLKQQAELAGARHRLGAAVDVQFAKDISTVLLHRTDRDDQLLCDRLV